MELLQARLILLIQIVYLEVDRIEAHRRAEDGNRPQVWHSYIDNWFDNVDLEVFGKEV